MSNQRNRRDKILYIDNKDKVNQGRYALYGMGGITAVVAIVTLFVMREGALYDNYLKIILVTLSITYFLLGYFSLKYPKICFIIGFIIMTINLIGNIVSINVLAMIISLVVLVLLYNGIQGARYLENVEMDSSSRDDILDSGFN